MLTQANAGEIKEPTMYTKSIQSDARTCAKYLHKIVNINRNIFKKWDISTDNINKRIYSRYNFEIRYIRETLRTHNDMEKSIFWKTFEGECDRLKNKAFETTKQTYLEDKFV